METISLCIYHSGTMKLTPSLHYDGAKVSTFPAISAGSFTYDELKKLIASVSTKPVSKIHYKAHGKSLVDGLRFVGNDDHMEGLIQLGQSKDAYVHVYVEHEEDGNEHGRVNEDEHDRDNQEENYEDGMDSESNDSLDYLSEGEEESAQVRKEKKKYKQALTVTVLNGQTTPQRDEIREEYGDFGLSQPVNEIDDLLEDIRKFSGEVDLSGYDKEYRDSSDYNTPDYETSDEEHDSQTKGITHYPIFDPSTPWDKMEPVIGMRFADCQQMKHCLTCYAVNNGRQLRWIKTSKILLVVGCKRPCKWSCRGSYMQKEKSFQIKSLNNVHTCVRDFKGVKIAGSSWVAKMYANEIRRNPSMPLSEMAFNVTEKFKINLNEQQCYRAKQKAMHELDDALREHYSRLFDYEVELMRSNPGTTVKFDTIRSMKNELMFYRFYVCFNALKVGWKAGCRPIIGLDGCFLKGYCKGQLLCAIGRDGNNNMFPIAWAVVKVENEENWTWFCQLLKADIDLHDGDPLTIITDQQKGLLNALQYVFPSAETRNCARHIYANFRKRFGGVQLRTLFWQAVKCGTSEACSKVFKKIKETNRGAYDYLLSRDPKNWCRGYFSTATTCDSVENNMAEIFNFYIIKARKKAIISLLEDIRVALMKRLGENSRLLIRSGDKLCTRIRKKLEKNKDEYRHWFCVHNGHNKFEVTKGVEGFTVDMGNKMCSCRLWQMSGVPCTHAVCAINFIGDDPDSYVSPWLTVETTLKAYEVGLEPINGQDLWKKHANEKVVPPLVTRKSGRPKVQRYKTGEKNSKKDQRVERKQRTEVSRKGRKMKCTNCGGDNHNRRGCKNERVENDDELNYRRKRQRGYKTANENPGHGDNPTQNVGAEESHEGVADGEANVGSDETEVEPVLWRTRSAILRVTRGRKVNFGVRKTQVPMGFGAYVNETTGASYLCGLRGALVVHKPKNRQPPPSLRDIPVVAQTNGPQTEIILTQPSQTSQE